jgi:beta-glucosidase
MNFICREKNGVPIGPRADSDWLYVVPWGIRKLLNYIHNTYKAPWIMITENGVDVPNESSMPVAQALNDTFRIDYYSSYLENVAAAMNDDGVSIMGYYAWSLLVRLYSRSHPSQYDINMFLFVG